MFTTEHGLEGQPWRQRFDRIVLVRAPAEAKIARFVGRRSAGRELEPSEKASIEQDARARLALQTDRNDEYARECLLIENDGDLRSLRSQADAVWALLQQSEAASG